MKTSYYRKVKGTDPGAISISRGTPRGRRYNRYPQLAPGPWFKSVPLDRYKVLYQEILNELNPMTVWNDLHRLAEGAEPILLCFETPNQFCHRQMVASWFEENLCESVLELADPPPPVVIPESVQLKLDM